MMKKYVIALSIVLLFFFSLSPRVFAANEVCPAGMSVAALASEPWKSCCVPPQAVVDGGGCPTGKTWIGALSGGGCRAPVSCPALSFNCATNQCVPVAVPPSAGISCAAPLASYLITSPSVIHIGGNVCKLRADVFQESVSTYKLWLNSIVQRLVSISDSDCAIGQVPTWNDNGTPGDLTDDKWICGLGGYWNAGSGANANDIYNNNSGNVGIGTLTPSASLSVLAPTNKTGDLFGAKISNLSSSIADSLNKYGLFVQSVTGSWTTGSNIGLNVNVGGGTTNYAAVFTGGNVGIGTSTPGAKLDVYASGATTNHSYGASIMNTSSSSTFGKTKVGLYVQSIEPTGVPGANNWADMNVGLIVNATGSSFANYSALFYGGNVGIGPGAGLEIGSAVDLTHRLAVAGGARIEGDLELNVSSNNLTKINTGTSAGRVEIGNPTNQVEVNSLAWGVNGAGDAGFTAVNSSGDITSQANISATGTMNSVGCFGPVFQGKSSVSSAGKPDSPDVTGSGGGYYEAKAFCSSYGPGAHVCTTMEALNSINCGVATVGKAGELELLWVSNGAPSLPTPTNDCYGWTRSDSASVKGIQWRFNSTTGGAFYAQPCNLSVYFACCK